MKKFYLLLLIALSCHSIYAQTIRYVTAGGTGNGTSWGSASGDLQLMIDELAALDEATFPNRQVWVSAGTYLPTRRADATGTITLNDRRNSFVMRAGVKIYGGFATGQTSLATRDFAANPSILSGNIGNTAIDTDNAYHVVIGANDMTGAALDGFTITKGYATGTGTNSTAPSNAVTATVNGRSIPSSRAAGIILYYANNATFSNLKIEDNYNNSSDQSSGAVYLFYSGSVSFTNVEFKNNVCANNFGGALYTFGSTTLGIVSATFKNVSFIQNQAGSAGGAIYASSLSKLNFFNCRFIDNTSGGNGGAVFSAGVTTTGEQNEIKILNSVFSANESNGTLGGSAFFNSSGSILSISNATFYANDVKVGTSGGALHLANSASSSVKLYNSIFNANTAVTGNGDIYRNTVTFSIKNTLSQVYGTNGVEGNIVNPLPTSLFASTVSTDPNFLNLVEGAATEKGSQVLYNEIGDVTTDTDLAGNLRLKHSEIDLGAYEYQGTLPVSLLSYHAVKSGSTALLTWKTASEQNNQKFVIERGTSASNFTFLKEVAGAGNSTTALSYSVTDFAPLAGTNYYRLTQYDYNGTPTILGVEAVTFDLIEERNTVYPNPAKAYIWVDPSSSNEITSLNLISLTGKTLLTNNYAQTGTQGSVKFDLANIPAGTYILWINKGKPNAEKQKLLVVK